MNEISHREIYERLVAVEKKVDRVEENTAGMVKAFEAASGAFLVLEWLAKIAKPILWIAACGGVLYSFYLSSKNFFLGR
jgi:hypothetical protein